jgi:hypothetical protein
VAGPCTTADFMNIPAADATYDAVYQIEARPSTRSRFTSTAAVLPLTPQTLNRKPLAVLPT